MPILTILTPTYNRAQLLGTCFESLQHQSCMDFEWLVIDDGSTDRTEAVARELQEQVSGFPITYVKKQNGGKHTVLNESHAYIHGELTLILDDDDTLTEDAVETILRTWEQWRDNPRIWCMSFSRGSDASVPLVAVEDGLVANAIDYRINPRRDGDCAEVVRSEVFKNYTFPVFEGERFLGEDCMWITQAYDYDTVYYSKVIYLCSYLEDGLTKSGRSMRLQNPLGGMYRANLYQDRHFRLLLRIKGAILYDCYAFSAGNFWKYVRYANMRLLCVGMIPLGAFFYWRWNR